MRNGKKIGLSLSGGGYRATIYHLGTLKKLKELGILKDIDVISTNSGGSITGATYGLYGEDFNKFEEIIRKGVKSSVLKGILTSWRFILVILVTVIWFITVLYLLTTDYVWTSFFIFILLILLFLFFQFQLLPISKLNERMYNKFFFNWKNLSDLTGNLKLAINSTNLETGRLFTFSKDKMGDSFYDYPKEGNAIKFKSDSFPIARAVAASTCVPFAFTPVRISKEFYVDQEDISRAKPRLIDGGVYDNQGAHKITQINSSYSSEVVIVSDAGNAIPFKHTYRNTLTMLIRTSDIFMSRIKNLQMIQYLYQNHKIDKREIAYQSLGWDLDNSIKQFTDGLKKGIIMEHVRKSHNIEDDDIANKNWDKIEAQLKKSINYDSITKEANTKEELQLARKVKTGLSPLKDLQIKALINHAYIMTEIQVRLYCPTLFT